MAEYDENEDTGMPVLGEDTPSSHLEGKNADEEGGYWTVDEEILEEVHERRQKAARKQDQWRIAANEWYEFVAGQQWPKKDLEAAEDAKRPLVTFNRTGPIVNAIAGQQICNRQETRFLPRGEGDMKKAEIWGKVVGWAREQCDAEDEESDAFRDLLTCGMGWTCTEINYDEDPEGMVLEQRIDPRRFRWDPAARKKNLGDKRWVQCDWMYSEDEILEKWPDAEISIHEGPRWEPDAVDQPHDATNAWRYEENQSGLDEIEGKYRCIHEIHWRLEDTYQIADNGEVTKLTEPQWKQLVSRLKKLGVPEPKHAKTKSRVYYEAWVVGDTVLHKGKVPIKCGFEYECMTGLRDDKGNWYGIVAALMDPQRFANKTFSQIVGILNSNAKGGLIAESGAVEEKAKFESEWSKSDGVSWVNDGAVAGNRIQPKPPPNIPGELTKLLEYSVTGMRDVTGANVEFLGQTDKVQPGVVEMMRTKAGLVILAPWFDAMRLYMKRQGRLLGEYIYTYIADGRWVRISGLDDVPSEPAAPPPMPPGMGAPMGMGGGSPPGMRLPPGGAGGPPPMGPPPGMSPPQGMMPPPMGGGQPSAGMRAPAMGMGGTQPGSPPGGFPMGPPLEGGIRYIQLIKQPDVLKYDIVVEESTMSRDSRERNFQMLMTVVPMALQAGVPVPPEVLDYAPLPEMLRMKWKEKIKQEQNKPPQPPLPVLVEQIRGQNAMQLEQVKGEAKKQSDAMTAQLKDQHEKMAAAVEAQKQQAQALSENWINEAKIRLEEEKNRREAERKTTEVMVNARLDTFSTMLKGVLDMQKLAMTPAPASGDGNGSAPSAPAPNVSAIMDKMGEMMNAMMGQSQQGMDQLYRVMAAPIELTKDPATGTKVVRRLLQ
jgi:hypothetical protein